MRPSATAELRAALEAMDTQALGAELHAAVRELYPLCRSITGDGLRASLRILGRKVPLTLHEVPSGTRVFDWVVPREWNLRGARLLGPGGEVIADAARLNLHVLNYSVPFRGRVSLEELQTHLHSLPDAPELVPYRTSYYRDAWGFCLSHAVRNRLGPGEYQVEIDTTLSDGSLTYGELVHPAAPSDDEVLFSTHCCHPSLANDNCAGMAMCAELARMLCGHEAALHLSLPLRPWHHRRDHLARRQRGRRADGSRMASSPPASETQAGSPTSGAGAATPRSIGRRFWCCTTRAWSTTSGPSLLTGTTSASTARPDSICRSAPSPALLTASIPSTTPRPTTSLVKPDRLVDTLRRYLEVIEVLEGNAVFVNLQPKCEPQLGKRGLYDAVGGQSHAAASQMAMLWVLNLSDGTHSLIEVAERSGVRFPEVWNAAQALERVGLLAPTEPPGGAAR